MASRKEEKERLRKEREEREAQEKRQAQRRARRLRIGGAAAVLVVAAIAIAVAAMSGGDKGSKAASEGLQVTPGPWSAETGGLQKRAKALKLPDPSDTIYHVHAQLAVFLNGKRSAVPKDIGIDPGARYLASLHTHDDKGIIHMEAVEPYPFTLGQFFTIWGVKFTATQLGAYRPGNGLVLETWVNGRKVPSGPSYQMKSHDVIVVAFGKPGSAPKKVPAQFGAGE